MFTTETLGCSLSWAAPNHREQRLASICSRKLNLRNIPRRRTRKRRLLILRVARTYLGEKEDGAKKKKRERRNANGNEPNNQRLTKRGRTSARTSERARKDGGRGHEEIKHRKHSDLTPANSILHVLPDGGAARERAAGRRKSVVEQRE